MKMTVIYPGLGAPHAGWVAIDELAHILTRCFGAELLSPRTLPSPWIRSVLRREKLQFEKLSSNGGDVLFVVARGPEDLAAIRCIPQARSKFARIHAFVTDSYFRGGFVQETAEYDSITVTAHEDVPFVQTSFGIAVHQLYQGIDGLQWAPRIEHLREIDIMAFGRTPPSYHAALVQRFHSMNSSSLYLHSPLGHLSGPDVRVERAMLFKLLHRSRIALAFHLLVEPQGQRPRSMMVTSRWLESLLCGCIVAGQRPVSRMADEMLNWDGATVELPASPTDAVDMLQTMLASNETLAAQRRSNTYHMLRQHDWRDRIRTLCTLHEWQVPAVLQEELHQLSRLRDSWCP